MNLRKKILVAFACLLLVLLCFASCNDADMPTVENVNITYVYNNGEENKTESVFLLTFAKPADPERAGYKFVGWCTDGELTNFYNFDIAPQKDTVLYAKWEIDYDALMDNIVKEAMLFNVKIEAETITGSFFNPQSSITQGSGVIFHKANGYYYVLTNYHVVSPSESGVNSYVVIDAYGNEYSSSLLAGDAAYDLAILRFKASSYVSLPVAEIDSRIPSNKETLVCLSTPNGRFNSSTFGSAVNYETVEISNSDGANEIDFKVLWLDCYAEHGSSGGAILDADLEIVGICYAVASTKSGDFKYSLAIPAAEVCEFLELYKTAYMSN